MALARAQAATLIVRVDRATGASLGSGVVVADHGVVATSAQVVRDARAISIVLPTGESFPKVTVVNLDERLGVALLRVEGFSRPPVEFASTDGIAAGRLIFVMEAQLRTEATIGAGVVTAVLTGDGVRLLQLSVPASAGSSGSPVVDERGRLVGVIRGDILDGTQSPNIAVPIIYIREKVAAALAAAKILPQRLEDVVYLKDGSIIHGTIVEQRLGESVLIRTHDGNQFRYSLDRIERITKEAATAVRLAPAVGHKSAGLAFLFSAVYPGGGQAYNGEWMKAGIMMGVGTAAAVVWVSNGSRSCVGRSSSRCDQYNGGVAALLAVAIWSMIDAPISAGAINKQLSERASLEIGPRLETDIAIVRNEAAGLVAAPPNPQLLVSLARIRFW